jgi:hypothetical protein
MLHPAFRISLSSQKRSRSSHGLLVCLLICCAAQTFLAAQGAPAKIIVSPDTWGAVDDLGRVLPTYEQVGPPRKDRTVGIFYFTHNNEPRWSIEQGKRRYYLYDNDQIIALHGPTAGWWLVGPVNRDHWWGEPLFGYYRNADPWVIKEHAEMLADAGVDTLILDNTNGPTYFDVQKIMIKSFEELRGLGDKTPDFACFCGAKDWLTNYRNIYSAGLGKDLWFRWQGKPLMLIFTGEATQGAAQLKKLQAAIQNFFTLRYCWALDNPSGKAFSWFGNGDHVWPWIAYYPQHFGWVVNPKTPEEMSVTVGGWAISDLARDYHNGNLPPLAQQKPALGLCFAEQWNHAIKTQPQFVFVTGWNEWTAHAFPRAADQTGMKMCGHPIKQKEPFYVDEFNTEYSRDAEPAMQGIKDDYYYQLVSSIRRYKGVHPLAAVENHAINLNGPAQQWDEINPTFENNLGLGEARNFTGWGNGPTLPVYTKKPVRNEIASSRVCYDTKNVYFQVQCVHNISNPKDPNWMLLFIGSHGDPRAGWMGYDYVINQNVLDTSHTSISRNVAGKYQWQQIGTVRYRVESNHMELAIPRQLLGIADRIPAELHFKWCDDIEQSGDWTDFYLHGNCAPPFRYYFRAKFLPAPVSGTWQESRIQ